jgi:hypothetical protein
MDKLAMYTAKGGKVRNALLNQKTKRCHAEHKLEYDTITHIRQDNLGALDDRSVIEFTINMGTSAFSFLESPISIGYIFEKKQEGTDGKVDVWKPEAVNAKKYYIQEALGPSGFINRVKLFIGNVELARSDHAYANVYQALLTRYCRSGTRKDLHAHNIPNTVEDLVVANADAYTDQQEQPGASLMYLEGSL